MYINWNDYELLYLIKDGSECAKGVFYEKYNYLIYKCFVKYHLNRKILFQDFLQESLMVLERLIFRFDDRIPIRFYTYFNLVLKNLALKLKDKRGIQLTERSCEYLEYEPIYHARQNSIIYILQKEFEKESNLIKNMFDACFVKGISLANFCKEYCLNYSNAYQVYKKMGLRIEKILTKWLE